MKNCCRCGLEKEEVEFAFKNQAKGTRVPHCKECQRVYAAEHYRQNKDAYKRRARKNNPVYRRAAQAFVYRYLLAHPCVDCNEGDPVVLDFDHRDPSVKAFNISEVLRLGISLSRLKAEITKCDVRCANCHRRKTARDRGYFKIVLAV